MLVTRTFTDTVCLESHWMNSTGSAIDAKIREELQRTHGDQCVRDGFLYGDTVVLTNRGVGVVDRCVNRGAILYEVEFVATVCSLEEGESIRCQITRSNDEGLKCVATDEAYPESTPLDIILPIRWHDPRVQTHIRKNIKVGDTIHTTVIGARFDVRDRAMNVVVQLGEASFPSPEEEE